MRGCGGETGEDASLREDEGGTGDGEQGAFAGWVGDLKGGERFDQFDWSEGAGLVGAGQDLKSAWPTGYDEDVEFRDSGNGIFVVGVGTEGGARGGGKGVLAGGRKGTLESFGFWTESASDMKEI